LVDRSFLELHKAFLRGFIDDMYFKNALAMLAIRKELRNWAKLNSIKKGLRKSFKY